MAGGRIYYFAYDINKPAGGEKDVYDHVDNLNASGFDAYVLHAHRGYKHTWFDNNTRVINYNSFWSLYDEENDHIVLSESLGQSIKAFPGRKVIFNKGLYLGFSSLGRRPPEVYPYHDQTVVAVFAVSQHNLDHLRFAFPQARVFRMYTQIDCELFSFRRLAGKKRRVAMVVKATESLMTLYHILQARAHAGLNRFTGYEWIFLEGYSHRQIAEILQETLILISLNINEGLPRLVLEAMACGCLIAGCGAGPLKECLPVPSQFEPGNLIPLAEHLECVADSFPANVESWQPLADSGRKIAETYTLEQQRHSLISAWEQIIHK